ncbi:MAG TPA: SIMPL domain-containing protein [Pirellulales bacterium]|jgi:uncharacterized protein YggE|nr:SIMPL domain-containing protein [Pirellulales bacterium]
MKSVVIVTIAAAMLATLATSAGAQVLVNPVNPTSGITVTGKGEIVAKPDVVEIKLRIAGSAELTDDAIVKHRDARDRVLKAFEALKLDNLKADDLNLNVHSATSREQAQMIFRGNVPNTPAQIEVSSAVRVRLSGIDKTPPDELMKSIGKLLDTAKDSGAAVGPSDEEVAMASRYGRTTTSTMVRFVVSAAEATREQAYQKAVDDARQRAERLAKLHSSKLGPVLSVQEAFVSSDNISTVQQQPWELQQPDITPPGEINTENMTGAVFQVRLSVRFAIDSAEKMAAQSSTGAER